MGSVKGTWFFPSSFKRKEPVMKVAVTTAGGRLGRAIIKQTAAGVGRENVVGVARSPEKAADLGIEIRRGDYNQAENFPSAFRGVDVALIVSGFDSPDKRIQQHRNVIAGAKAAGVRKIVYTSIFGDEGKSSFDAIIHSNRQTEKDIQDSGLDWAIGRNGLYIDEDFMALDSYREEGRIANCAGGGRCAYTSRAELARAYARLIVQDPLNRGIYNLCGAPVTQQELTAVINEVFGDSLRYQPISVEDYLADRIRVHGDFLGRIIAGIYTGIREGAFDIASDFEAVCGRPHKDLRQMALEFKAEKSS